MKNRLLFPCSSDDIIKITIFESRNQDMLFSSLIFLWYFLPIVVLLYHLIPGIRSRNAFLLAASLFFYAWGEPEYIVLMVFSIALNYGFGIIVSRKRSKLILAMCIGVNLALLGYFKYFNFGIELVNAILPGNPLSMREIALPVGISFYTFQALSYVIDVYRGDIQVQRNPWKLALYISFFPQLIAGPIVKYHDIAKQLESRSVSWTKMAYGIKRFTYGLGKKVIFANTFAAIVDLVLERNNQVYMSTGLAWFAIALYALQIYYDFSGYSDMAIGLGKLFGFDFMENFNYPYLSGSVREFWRRWHISLSTWFKEYVYIPLGGSRKGNMRTYVNLFVVFLVTGLWHGAGINFVLWGAYYGIFLVAERLFLGKLLEKNPWPVFNHLYTMAVVLVGWVMFRIEELDALFHMWKVLFWGQGGPFTIPMFADRRIYFIFVIGVVLCGPLQAICPRLKTWLYQEETVRNVDVMAMAGILCLCLVLLICNTYNPFIYFRF